MVALLLAALLFLVPNIAWAYVGPGAGLGMIGSLIAVLGAILVALLGIVLFPIMVLRKRRKNKKVEKASTDAEKAD